MDICLSENLLATLVHCIRDTCRKHIKCEEFTAVSGFLCFDIDGKIQRRFVLSELINKANTGDGHSACLKARDWQNLSRSLKACPNVWRSNWRRASKARSPSALLHRSKDDRGCRGLSQQGNFGNNNRSKNRPVAKGSCGLSSPFQVSGSRNKASNRTFTLEDVLVTEKAELLPVHNISTATISIASKLSSPRQLVCSPDSPYCRDTSTDFDSSPSSPCLTYPMGSTFQGSPVIPLYRKSHPGSPQSSNALCTSKLDKELCPHTKNDTQSYTWFENCENKRLNKGQSAMCFRGRTFTQASPQSQVNLRDHALASNARKTYSLKSCSRSNQTLKTFGNEKNLDTSKSNLAKRNHVPALCLDSESSDECIGSIRPLYLVQHNDELLLPCPNLSEKLHKYTTATPNNEMQNLINQKNEEKMVGTSPPKLSSLINSVIGVLSTSSPKYQQNESNNTDAGLVDLDTDKLEKADRFSLSADSATTLNTVSSLEVDSPQSYSHHSGEKASADMTEEETVLLSNKDGLSDTCPVNKQRSRVFKLLRLFSRDGSCAPGHERLRKRNDSFTSLRSWSSVKSFIASTSKDANNRKKLTARKQGQ